MQNKIMRKLQIRLRRIVSVAAGMERKADHRLVKILDRV